MTKPISEEPKFIQSATAIQKWMSGIAVSLFLVVWVTGWTFISDFFKPDFIQALMYLRISLAFIGITITGFVGYEQMKKMMDWAFEAWLKYKEATEGKKEK